MIQWLDSHRVSAYGKTDAPGVYLRRDGVEAKIAALGLRVRNGCTYHGLAVNVAMDLAPFADIDPCGFPGLAVTQLADVAPRTACTVERAGDELAPILAAPPHRIAMTMDRPAVPPARPPPRPRQRRRRQAQGRREDGPHPDQGGRGARG